MRILLIVNPVAGNGAAKAAGDVAEAYFTERGVDYTLVHTTGPDHATALAREAAGQGYDRVVAVGGDGTVREAALGLIFSELPLGVIPCGTGNDLARPLGLPIDVQAAAKIALDGEALRIDAAQANEQIFFNVAGFGFDVDVLDYTEIYKKKIKRGSTAYLMGLLRAILGLKSRDTLLESPEQEPLHKNALLVAVGNGTHFGGGMCITPDASLTDGLLEVTILHDVSRAKAPFILPKFLKGTIFGTKYATQFRVRELTCSCTPVSRIEVDGERMEGTPVHFKILDKALTVIVPRKA